MEISTRENTRTDTKQFLILKIGRIANRMNPNFYNEITSKEIESLKKKTRAELKNFIKELEGSEMKRREEGGLFPMEKLKQ